MNTKFESDPSLLDAAVEVMRFAVDRCEADAAALARLDTRRPWNWPRSGSRWRRRRTRSCSSSPNNEKRPVQRTNAGQGRSLKQSRKQEPVIRSIE